MKGQAGSLTWYTGALVTIYVAKDVCRERQKTAQAKTDGRRWRDCAWCGSFPAFSAQQEISKRDLNERQGERGGLLES